MSYFYRHNSVTYIIPYFLISHIIDFTTFQDSATERIVGKDIDGNNIYEQTLSGTVNFTANTRTLITRSISNVRRVLSVEGWVELPVSSSDTKWPTSIGQQYYTGALQASAASWSYVDPNYLNTLTVAAFGAANSTNNNYYITCRYTKLS